MAFVPEFSLSIKDFDVLLQNLDGRQLSETFGKENNILFLCYVVLWGCTARVVITDIPVATNALLA